ERSHVFALKAMCCSSQEVWKALKRALGKIGAQVCLIENNLRVTEQSKVMLELKFTNYYPRNGAWTVRDIIRVDSEHHEGVLRFDLGNDLDTGTLEVKFGDGNTGWRPDSTKWGTYIAEGKGKGRYLPQFDTQPLF